MPVAPGHYPLTLPQPRSAVLHGRSEISIERVVFFFRFYALATAVICL